MTTLSCVNLVTIAQAVSKLHRGWGAFEPPPPPLVPEGQQKPGLDRVNIKTKSTRYVFFLYFIV